MFYIYLMKDIFHFYNHDFTRTNQLHLHEVLENSGYAREEYFWETDETKERLDKLCSERKDIKYLGTLGTISPESIVFGFPEVFL